MEPPTRARGEGPPVAARFPTTASEKRRAGQRVFEFLFKYRPVVFERGDLSLAVPWWGVILVFLGLGAVVWFALQYRRIGPTIEARDRWVLMALRAAALGVLAFLLLRPVLLVSTVVPRRNFVAVLLDDSRSMRVADEDGETRAQRVLDLFGRHG